MRKFLRLISIICVLVVGLMSVSCKAGGEPEEEVDITKTQLNVNHYDGGFGDEWLWKAKYDFEEKYKDTSFEDGKVGVQVWISNNKNGGKHITNQILGSRDHIFINESIFYYDYLSQDLMLDITDVVTNPLTEFGEEKTIESKLEQEQKDFLKVDTKYYAIPHYFGTNGISYDVELFNERGLFLSDENRFECRNTDENLSLGGDGIKGTFDDGLPATYQDFYNLCITMQERGIIPIIWAGNHQFYVDYFLAALAAEANTAVNFELLHSFNGKTDRMIKSFDGDKPVLGEGTVGDTNRYDAYNQAGGYYALEFIHDVISNKYYDPDYCFGEATHTDTQDRYLLSNREQSFTPIGMIIEGNWWENEADDTFKMMADRYSEAGRMDRDFGFMPLPKPNESFVGERHTMVEANNAYMFIKSNIEEKYIDVAKKFLAFINTDAKLREFSRITNTPKSLKYDMTEEDKAVMSKFGKSVFEYKNSEYTDTVYQCSTAEVFYSNLGLFDMQRMFATTNYEHASTAFHYYNVGTKAYFNEYLNRWKTNPELNAVKGDK